jgi:hypothetical protein
VKTIILSFLLTCGLFAQDAKIYEVPASDAEQGRILWETSERLRKQYQEAFSKFEQWRIAAEKRLVLRFKIDKSSNLEFTGDFRFATIKEWSGWQWPTHSMIGCTSFVDSSGEFIYKCDGRK